SPRALPAPHRPLTGRPFLAVSLAWRVRRKANKIGRLDAHDQVRFGSSADATRDAPQSACPGDGGRARYWGVWVRRSAIRPVPPYARVPAHALDAVRDSLAEDDEEARAQLDEAFERFERTQGTLAAHVTQALSQPLDETALAHGSFLGL